MTDAMIARLALALKATASRFRNYDPRTDDVLDSVAEYLEQPDRAHARLTQEDESNRRLRRIR